MSKEAMKLRTAAEKVVELCSERPLSLGKWFIDMSEACESLREALAEPDFWDGYVPEPDNTCNNALREQGKAYPRTCKKCGLGPCVELAQQALDKKAENARELGLDYEPAQQEPVAWTLLLVGEHHGIIGKAGDAFASAPEHYRRVDVYTSPPAQRTWVGLTDVERRAVRNSVPYSQFMSAGEYAEHVQKATEFMLLEKNT